MAVLQKHRPDVDHTALIAAVEAAATWTEASEDYLVTSLLGAVGGEEAADAAYVALTGVAGRRPPGARAVRGADPEVRRPVDRTRGVLNDERRVTCEERW